MPISLFAGLPPLPLPINGNDQRDHLSISPTLLPSFAASSPAASSAATPFPALSPPHRPLITHETTFTYFTTRWFSPDDSTVVTRKETITNYELDTGTLSRPETHPSIPPHMMGLMTTNVVAVTPTRVSSSNFHVTTSLSASSRPPPSPPTHGDDDDGSDDDGNRGDHRHQRNPDTISDLHHQRDRDQGGGGRHHFSSSPPYASSVVLSTPHSNLSPIVASSGGSLSSSGFIPSADVVGSHNNLQHEHLHSHSPSPPPPLVTPTPVTFYTTFTYFTTELLPPSSLIVHSREEVVTNVIEGKVLPTRVAILPVPSSTTAGIFFPRVEPSPSSHSSFHLHHHPSSRRGKRSDDGDDMVVVVVGDSEGEKRKTTPQDTKNETQFHSLLSHTILFFSPRNSG